CGGAAGPEQIRGPRWVGLAVRLDHEAAARERREHEAGGVAGPLRGIVVPLRPRDAREALRPLRGAVAEVAQCARQAFPANGVEALILEERRPRGVEEPDEVHGR